jgi:geranylgeranyl diphosphate synthase, type II
MQKSYQQMRESVESALLRLLPQCRHAGARQLDDALNYVLFPGGKRLRPVLTILGAGIFDSHPDRSLPAACAVEFVHTSSLIFDDLPCMDDANIRRGNPALHCVYGEDIALLAGIALLNAAYAIFGQTPELIREATACIGVDGMIGGQMIDLCSNSFDTADLGDRNRKTSAMMRLALTAGALGGGASCDDVAPLAGAGLMLGEAYQRGDDMLDSCGTAKQSGKTAGQDSRHKRLSHANLDSETWLQQITALIEGARHLLEEAYGRNKTAPLISFIDGMFASLTARAHGSN